MTEGNAGVEADPSLVNSDAEGGGWFFKLTIADKGELEGLLDEAAYRSFAEKLS